MLKQLFISTTVLLISLPVFADVQIIAPEEIVVVAIDDQEIRGGLFRGKQNTYKLNAGQHSFSVKYEQIFNHSSGEHDVLKSNIVTLNQVILKEGENYHLTLVDLPTDFEQAKIFAEQPTIAIKNQSGQVVAQQTGASSKSKSWLSNGIFSTVFDLRQEPETIKVSQVNHSQSATINTANSSKDQLLIELWKTATPQERQKFAAWLAEQASK